MPRTIKHVNFEATTCLFAACSDPPSLDLLSLSLHYRATRLHLSEPSPMPVFRITWSRELVAAHSPRWVRWRAMLHVLAKTHARSLAASFRRGGRGCFASAAHVPPRAARLEISERSRCGMTHLNRLLLTRNYFSLFEKGRTNTVS